MIILIITIPTICSFTIEKLGGIGTLIELQTTRNLQIFGREDLVSYICLFIVFMIPDSAPTVIQRFLMGNSIEQVRGALFKSAAIKVVFILWITGIGFITAVNFPNVDANLALPTLIAEMLPPILKGITVVGILAVIMSTADSVLNSGAILLVNDIIKPFLNSCVKKRYISKEYTKSLYMV